MTTGQSGHDLSLAPCVAETRTVSISVTAEETGQTFRWTLDEPSAWMWIQRTSSTYCHYTGVAVHRDVLAAADTVGCHAGPQHRGDVGAVILATSFRCASYVKLSPVSVSPAPKQPNDRFCPDHENAGSNPKVWLADNSFGVSCSALTDDGRKIHLSHTDGAFYT